MTALFGMDVEVNGVYNYQRDGSALAQGAPVVRHYAEDGYETYAQDTWKVKPNLTLTLGLRYSLFSPPWETKGLEVTPTESLNTWFNNRGVGMNNGVPSIDAPPVAFNWSGPANGGTTGYYGWDFKNLGPRVAFAWAPGYDDGILHDLFGSGGKTSIRGGFGIVYDRIGEGLLDTFDAKWGLRTIDEYSQRRRFGNGWLHTARHQHQRHPYHRQLQRRDSHSRSARELSSALPQ